MFNLFGSLFFGQRPVATTTADMNSQPESTHAAASTTNEASTQTSSKQTAHTQTAAMEHDLHMKSNDAEEARTQYSPFIGPLNYNEYHQHNQSSNDWVIVDRSEEADKCFYKSNTSHKTTHLSAEAGINTSTIMQQDNNEQTQEDNQTITSMQLEEQEDEAEEKTVSKMFERSDEDNDIILGSFFEKNEIETEAESQRYTMNREESDEEEDDEGEQGVQLEKKPQANDWQITPLPCLTSTTWSQRSLVADDPLENLLIEHPSMSVFVSATSSSNNTVNTTHKQRKNLVEKRQRAPKSSAIDEDESDDMLTMLFKTAENTVVAAPPAQPQTIVEVKAVVLRKPLSVVKMNKQAQVAPVVVELVKKTAEKRKESSESSLSSHHHHMISVVNNFHSGCVSPPPMLRNKKGKKNKKSSAASNGSSSASSVSVSPSGILAQSPIGPHTRPVSFNKENQQVKTLLLNEFKRGGAGCMGAHTRSLDPVALLNKNQMKRANKNSTFSSSKSLNQKQRKYHQLQQPAAVYSASANMQF